MYNNDIMNFMTKCGYLGYCTINSTMQLHLTLLRTS